MKLIIAGSRDLQIPPHRMDDFVQVFIDSRTERYGSDPITEVVSGVARGVDLFGIAWAKRHGIPVKDFPVTDADWKLYGKSAGPRRNRLMAEYADDALIIWDGKSPGSRNMAETMRGLGKPCLRINYHGRKTPEGD